MGPLVVWTCVVLHGATWLAFPLCPRARPPATSSHRVHHRSTAAHFLTWRWPLGSPASVTRCLLPTICVCLWVCERQKSRTCWMYLNWADDTLCLEGSKINSYSQFIIFFLVSKTSAVSLSVWHVIFKPVMLHFALLFLRVCNICVWCEREREREREKKEKRVMSEH